MFKDIFIIFFLFYFQQFTLSFMKFIEHYHDICDKHYEYLQQYDATFKYYDFKKIPISSNKKKR